jgi:cellobiose phosphorylase
MFEQMLKELLLKLLREDLEVQAAVIGNCDTSYDRSVQSTVKYVIENDETVQDVIRKQATTDIWEAIEDDVSRAIDRVVDNLNYDITVSR